MLTAVCVLEMLDHNQHRPPAPALLSLELLCSSSHSALRRAFDRLFKCSHAHTLEAQTDEANHRVT